MKTSRSSGARKIAPNTKLEVLPDGTTRITLHHTVIAEISADGKSRKLNTGGYHTKTTTDRINRFCLPPGYRLSKGLIYGPGKSFVPLKDEYTYPF